MPAPGSGRASEYFPDLPKKRNSPGLLHPEIHGGRGLYCSSFKNEDFTLPERPELSTYPIPAASADYPQKEVCTMDYMEPAPLWELFCLTGEPLAYMLYRSIEDESENNLS